MKKNYVVGCIVLAMAVLSGCAGFKTIREAEDFLSTEKAKNIKPVVEVYKSGYTTPMDSTGKWVAAAVVATPVAFVAAPLATVGAAIGAQTGLMVATKESKVEDLWFLTGAKIEYGRMALYQIHKWDENGKREYLHTSLDMALMTVGPPPAPCEIAKKISGWGDNKGANRFKRTNNYVTDKEARQGIFMTNYMKIFVFYKTVKENKPVENEAPAYCTKELADEHFAKVLKYMEGL